MAESSSSDGRRKPFDCILKCMPCYEESQEDRNPVAASRPVKKTVPTLTDEERERARLERAKSAWHRISKKAMLEVPESHSPGDGFRKASNALIKLSKRRDSQTTTRVFPSSPLPSSTQDEILRRGSFSSLPLTTWNVDAPQSAGPSQSTSPIPVRVDEKPNDTIAPDDKGFDEAISSPELLPLQGPRFSPEQSSSPDLTPASSASKAKEGRVSSAVNKLLEFGAKDGSTITGSPTPRHSRNSVDSPRLSQGQAILARLGAPGSLSPSTSNASTLASSTEKSPKSLSPAAAAIRSPMRSSMQSTSSSLKEDAYAVLMQQNKTRLRNDLRRASVEGRVTVSSSPESPAQ